jgi:hypothetical protein
MRNAKDEFIKVTEGKTIKCCVISLGGNYDSTDEDVERITLVEGGAEELYAAFLDKLDFQYDNGYGGQYLFGVIWFTDGTWAERGEYDGAEWWEIKECPEVPEYLKREV